MQIIFERLISREIHKCPKSILLLGPRQTGKSTLMHFLSPDMIVDLSSETEYLDHHSNPRLLEELIRAKTPKTVLVDEIQRIPAMLNTIQSIIDRSKRETLKSGNAPIQFFLTGSSARKLRRGGANLLPGRIVSFELGPLVAKEVGGKLDVDLALARGTLPEIYSLGKSPLGEKILTTYAATYLKEEIQAEVQLRTLSGFARFLRVAAENSGNYLDLSKLSKQAKVPRQSAVRYFEILEDTLIAYRLGPCTWTPGADLVKHPRFFFFDVGVLNGILKEFSTAQERKGRLFEHLVFSQILFTAKALGMDIEIENYRTRGGVEIDFVFKWGKAFVAVECKATRSPSDSDTKGLHLFAQACSGRKELILVVPELDQQRQIGKVHALGLNDFLAWLVGLAE